MRMARLTPPRSLSALWRDDCGFILSAELVLILTLGVLAMVVGIHAVAKAINAELIDAGQAFSNLNQSYFVHGFAYYCPRVGLNASTGGSGFIDGSDICDCAGLVVTSRGAGVVQRSQGGAVVSGSPVVSGGSTVIEAPATVAPATPCPAGAPCTEAITPCPGDCPCGLDQACPPGATLDPVPLETPADAAPAEQPQGDAPK